MGVADALLQLFEDTKFFIVNILDTSKRLMFDLSGSATNTSVTLKSKNQADITLDLPKESGTLERLEATRSELVGFIMDYKEAEILYKSLPSSGTLSIINPIQGKSAMIEVTPNGFTLNLPSYAKVMSGKFKTTTVNYIYFHCINDATPTYLVTIGQQQS